MSKKNKRKRKYMKIKHLNTHKIFIATLAHMRCHTFCFEIMLLIHNNMVVNIGDDVCKQSTSNVFCINNGIPFIDSAF